MDAHVPQRAGLGGVGGRVAGRGATIRRMSAFLLALLLIHDVSAGSLVAGGRPPAKGASPEWGPLDAALLYASGLPVAAEGLYARALDAGPDRATYAVVLDRLVRIAVETDEWSTLSAHIATIDVDAASEEARPWLLWVRARHGRQAVDERIALLRAVPNGVGATIRARYLQGVLHARSGELGGARDAFAAVLREVQARHRERVPAWRVKELDRARDRALVGMAATFYAAERYAEARRWADRVRETSPVWPDAQLVALWAELMLIGPSTGEEDPVAVAPARARYAGLVAREDLPAGVFLEASLVAALTDTRVPACGNLGPWIEDLHLDAEARYRPVAVAMQAALKALPESDRAVFDGGTGVFPAEVARDLDADPHLVAVRRKLAAIGRERTVLEEPTWLGPLGTAARAALDAAELRLRGIGGRRIRWLAERAGRGLRDGLATLEIAHFETMPDCCLRR